jgi:hypothetical protein
MAYHVLVKKKYAVACLESIGEDWTTNCPGLDFLAKAHNDANTRKSCNGYSAMFHYVAEHGPGSLTGAMSHEANKENSLMELIKGRLRLLYFTDGDTIYITNGYLKSSQKADPAEVARAISARNAFYKK